MDIKLAESDREIDACFAVMKELRPHLQGDDFCRRVRAQQADGYKLAYIAGTGGVVAVAGFRSGANLAWGNYIYIDDLVTAASTRSKGYGKALLEYIKSYGAERGCEQLHLDSGVQRHAAHRFYEREGLLAASLHFACPTRG